MEGLCGEGTRVIVNLLNTLGFDAARITLYDISSKDFNLMHYSDDVYKRRKFKKLITDYNKSECHIKFFTNYWLYYYESIPYTKLLTKLGFDLRIFNFKRTPHLISVLAEKPNLLMCFLYLCLTVFVTCILHKLNVFKKLLRIEK